MMIRSQMEDSEIDEVHIVADPNDTEKWFLNLPVHFHTYEGSRAASRIISVTCSIGSTLRGIGPDVVILHNTYAGLWGRLILNKRWRTIYCAHGWSFTQKTSFMRKLLYGAVEALMSFRCDAIVSISPHEYRLARLFGVWGTKHYLIQHGVLPAAPDDGQQLELIDGVINLAFVGRFERQKGVDLLVEMFEDPALGGVHLWLVGDNVRGSPEIAIPEKLNVTRLVWLSRGRTDAVLQQMDAVIMPSRWEGFGLVAIEGMRSGCPIIANNVGGLGRLIEDGVNGYLMNVDDIPSCRALLASLSKSELKRRGGLAYRTYQESFRWADCYTKWCRII